MQTAQKLDHPNEKLTYEPYFDRACSTYRKTSRLPSKLVESHIELAENAANIWYASSPCEEHEFLTCHKVKAFGLRQYNNLLIAPIHDLEGVIWNYYPIQLDCNTPWSGRLNHCFFQIGEPDSSKTIYLCLDYVTAASVHMATGQQVAIVFQVGNLESIVVELKKVFSAKRIVIAADLDIEPDQAMHSALLKVAKKHGCKYVIPKLAKHDPEGELKFLGRPLWNWNDVHRIYGIQAVTDLLAKAAKP